MPFSDDSHVVWETVKSWFGVKVAQPVNTFHLVAKILESFGDVLESFDCQRGETVNFAQKSIELFLLHISEGRLVFQINRCLRYFVYFDFVVCIGLYFELDIKFPLKVILISISLQLLLPPRCSDTLTIWLQDLWLLCFQPIAIFLHSFPLSPPPGQPLLFLPALLIIRFWFSLWSELILQCLLPLQC